MGEAVAGGKEHDVLVPVEAAPSRRLEGDAGFAELHVRAHQVRSDVGHRRARHELPDLGVVVGGAEHLPQAAAAVGQGLGLEIDGSFGLLSSRFQSRQGVTYPGEPGRIDRALDQHVALLEEELALRLREEAGRVIEDLFRGHGDGLRVVSEREFEWPRR